MSKAKVPGLLSCSFCHRRQDEVDKLISGLGVYICNDCVDLCNEVMRSDRARFPMVAEDAPEVKLCTLAADGTTTPVTGIDFYIGGVGPFIRVGGRWKRSDNGEGGRLSIGIDPAKSMRALAAWIELG